MEMQQLHAFVILAQYENMSMVAQVLNTSQPQVSKLISSLEAELGVQLFDRVGRGLRLSEHGRLFLQYAEEALNSMQHGRIAMKNLRNSLLGTVHIGTFAFAQAVMPCCLAYTGKNPHVNFFFPQNSNIRQQDMDLILAPFTQGHYTSEGDFPISFPILEEDFFLVLSPRFRDYPSGKASIDLRETKDFPYIIMGQFHLSPNSDYSLVQTMVNILNFTPRVAYQPNEFATKMMLVDQGAGVAFLPTVCLSTARLLVPDLRVFSIENFSTRRSVLLARKKRAVLTPAANDFWDFALEFFHQPPDTWE